MMRGFFGDHEGAAPAQPAPGHGFAQEYYAPHEHSPAALAARVDALVGELAQVRGLATRVDAAVPAEDAQARARIEEMAKQLQRLDAEAGAARGGPLQRIEQRLAQLERGVAALQPKGATGQMFLTAVGKCLGEARREDREITNKALEALSAQHRQTLAGVVADSRAAAALVQLTADMAMRDIRHAVAAYTEGRGDPQAVAAMVRAAAMATAPGDDDDE